MFGSMFAMAGNYEQRCVGRHDIDDHTFISTAEIYDGSHPYETGVKHPEYNDGSMVIVEAYDTREEAEAGHAKWVKTMTADELPTELVDCCNAGIAQLCDALSPDDWNRFPRVRKN